MQIASLVDRVGASANMLDFVTPGWAEKVDLDIFDMGCISTDLVCQINGKVLLMDYEENKFRDLVFTANVPTGAESYEDLTDAWVAQIKQRL